MISLTSKTFHDSKIQDLSSKHNSSNKLSNWSSARSNKVTVYAASSSDSLRLACPVVLKPLNSDGLCPESGLRYSEDSGVWDLTVGAGVPRSGRSPAPATVQEAVRALLPRELRGFLPISESFGSSTFELPSVAFAYERGWRQSFARAGFPGPDEEFEMARRVFRNVEEKKGVVVDASCGSGLFTRRFVQTGTYSQVIALDFSDSMLQQARAFCEEEGVKSDSLTFVRADIARIPFADNSVDAVHAGAAIHCWPAPKEAAAEIFRVLKPGGTYCGTTFLNRQIPFLSEELQAVASSLSRGIASRGGFIQLWDKRTLQDVFESVGLVDFDCEIRREFIFYSVKKPFPVDFVPSSETIETGTVSEFVNDCELADNVLV